MAQLQQQPSFPAAATGVHGDNNTEKVLCVMEAIHDFEARGDDELTLLRGELVEVIENDDEFGDGWYLGQKATGLRGLFPKVYTNLTQMQTIPKLKEGNAKPDLCADHNMEETTSSLVPTAITTATTTTSATAESTIDDSTTNPTPAAVAPIATADPPASPLAITPSDHPASRRTSLTERERSDLHRQSQTASTHSDDHSIPTPPLSVEKISGPPTPTLGQFNRPTSSGDGGADRKNYVQGLRSPTVEDTLSDIEEAISEISKNKAMRDHNRRHVSMPVHQEGRHEEDEEVDDSGSEYSIPIPTAGDFQSEDEDEDEHDAVSEHAYDFMDEIPYTKEDVMAWSPGDVAQFLHSRELPPDVCDKFEEQEVAGAILLELEMGHLKELEIGSFGKRFKVWKEIEFLTKNLKPSRSQSRSKSHSRLSVRYSEAGGSTMGRRRSSTVGSVNGVAPMGMVLPRIQSQHNRGANKKPTISIENTDGQSDYLQGYGVFSYPDIPLSPRSSRLHPSSRHSISSRNSFTADLPLTSTGLNAAMAVGTAVLAAGGHQRDGSFDRNWMAPGEGSPRPSTATGMRDTKGKHKASQSSETNLTIDSGFSGSQPPTPNDRAYFSSCEASTTPREKRVLHKKQPTRSFSTVDDSMSRRRASVSQSTEELFKKTPVSAAFAYHMSGKDKRKSASLSGSVDLSLTNPSSSSIKSSELQRKATDEVSLTQQILSHPFLSDGGSSSVVSSEKPQNTTVSSTSVLVPPPTSSSAPPEGKKSKRSKSSKTLKSSSKAPKKTSAMTNGIRTITPAEAAESADYSGWIKKRGSSGVGAWKSRFFVLQGRRLSYFYSEKDTKERGLIDITSHKVLPCTDDRIVGLHATFAAITTPDRSPRPSPLQRSVSSPPPPSSTSTPTSPTAKSTSSPTKPTPTTTDPATGLPPIPIPAIPPSRKKTKKSDPNSNNKSWFVFKLVPPAPGAAKGVTFTPPRLHYFATDTREEGKKWMAALMKATIDRDETKPVITSYNAKTISLKLARELRARPPGLGQVKEGLREDGGLGILLGEGEEGGEADVEDAGEGREKVRVRDSGSTGGVGLGDGEGRVVGVVG